MSWRFLDGAGIIIPAFMAFFATTAVAETMRFATPFGEEWEDFVELTQTEHGLVVRAFFDEAEETGLIPGKNFQDINSITSRALVDYQRDDGHREVIEFVVNELDVLEIGFAGAVWLVKDVYLPDTPPPARPW